MKARTVVKKGDGGSKSRLKNRDYTISTVPVLESKQR